LVDTVIPSTGSPQQLEKTVGRGIQKAMEMQPVLEKALRERDPTALVDWALEDPSYAASTEATRRRLREIYSDNAYSFPEVSAPICWTHRPGRGSTRSRRRRSSSLRVSAIPT
jgi:hypothetical protein